MKAARKTVPLAVQHRRFGIHMAVKWARRYPDMPFDEFESAAMTGLVHAERTYDPTRGAKFITWAAFWVNREIRGVLRESSLIRIPSSTQQGMMRRRGQAIQQFTVLSLDAPRFEDGSGALADRVADPHPSAAVELEDAEANAGVRAQLMALPARLRLVIGLRFGFHGDPPMTLLQIGRVFGLSRERIRQMESQALEILQRGMTGQRSVAA